MEGSVFNQVTNLLDYDAYKKKVQESTEIFDYRTDDIQNQPICYMTSQALQGFDVRSAPSKLIDVESYLLTQPLREEIDHYVLDDNVRNTKPQLPTILQTRLMIPDCKDIIKTKYDHLHKEDVWNREYNYGPSQFSLVTEPSKQQYVASPGIDTRMAVKDAYKKIQQQKIQEKMGTSDPVLAPEVNCALDSSSLACMHLFGPDAVSASEQKVKQLHPAVPIGQYAQQLGIPTSSSSGPTVSSETLQVAATIDPNMKLAQLVQEQEMKQGCGTQFYAWKSPPC